MKIRDIPVPIFVLIVGGFIQSAGNSLLWPINSIFVHNVLGKSMTEAGLILALQSVISLLGQFVSGSLADRYGARRVMLYGLSGACLTVGFIGIFPTWGIYAPSFILFGLAQAFIIVPLNALIHVIWPEGGRRGFNLLYVFSNAGVALGTALGGIVAQVSFKLVFGLNSLTFFIFLILVLVGTREHSTSIHMLPPTNQVQKLYKDPNFKVLFALASGIFLLWGAYIQIQTVMPLVMHKQGYSLASYSLLWTLNGLFIVTLQPLISWLVRNYLKTFKYQFYAAALLFGIGFFIILEHTPYVYYIVSMLILTIGEMLVLPGVPAAAAELAPKGRIATYQGFVGAGSAGGRTLGPLLGGLCYDIGSGSFVWVLAIIFSLTGLIAFFIYAQLQRKFVVHINPNVCLNKDNG